MNKKKILYYLIIITLCSIDVAMAASGGGSKNSAQQYFRNLVMNDVFKSSMDIGFMIFATLKWYNYFNSFNPSTAFLDIVLPAFITFMAFNWITFLQFVQILPGSTN
jgi:hypothetical protein